MGRACARGAGSRQEVTGIGYNRAERGVPQAKKSLEDNLSARGLVEEVFSDKVQEYMDLWRRRQQLEEDIEARGCL